MDTQHDSLPFEIGTVLGDQRLQYRLDDVVGSTQEAVVYLATAMQPSWYGHHDSVKVSTSVLVPVVRQPVGEVTAVDTDDERELKAQMQRALKPVDPAVAGFAEWRTIRRDDSVLLALGIHDGFRWGALELSSYRRWMASMAREARRPHTFSATTKRSLLLSAENRCQRCGSPEDLEIDHTIPISFGGTNHPANGLVLCKPCHLSKSRAERRAFGLSIDPAHSKGTFPPQAEGEAFLPYLQRYLDHLRDLTGWSLDIC